LEEPAGRRAARGGALTTAVIAEKPSVARDLAAVLGAGRQDRGALVGGGYIVTWAIGHLVGLAEPHEIEPAWRAWRLGQLPMIPERWPLKVHPKTRDQFETVERILNSPDVEQVVCATDAGREGELIFRYLYRMARCRKPVLRLWLSSLTPEAIRAAFAVLRPGHELDGLAAAAEGRSRADWLVGMNFSRAYTLRFGPGLRSVGRVQTPTLAMLADRERAIARFVPEPYCEVVAHFGTEGDSYRGTWFDRARARGEGPERLAQRLPADGQLAETIRKRCAGGKGEVKSRTGSDRSQPPPLLYDLTELQRHANRLYGMTAEATLTAAQSLYERHKLLSYPRTGSRHLSAAVAATLGPITRAIAPAYGEAVAQGSGERPLSRRFVDDAKVTDHHALIPTNVSPSGKALGREEERIYDLVCRRLLMAWHSDHLTRSTQVVTAVGSEGAVDSFRSSGTVVTQVGWKVLDLEPPRPPQRARGKDHPVEDGEAVDDKADLQKLPDGLAPGQVREVVAIEIQRKKTEPPRRFTEATLLTAMETAGRSLDSHELEEVMRERGLGTPATRAATIETLVDRAYVERRGRSLRPTPAGLALIDEVDEAVKSPALTAEWELALKGLEQGHGTLPEFMAKIERFVRDLVAKVVSAPAPARELPGPSGLELPLLAPEPAVNTEPGPVAEVGQVFRERFRYEAFRPYQEEVCRAVAAGADALLVMPTGSGKSLCYQVPGLARGGTTLVVSPLIALMEDQTEKLRSFGFRADRVHSGRGREDSRAACRAYVDGSLDFLAIAPERLSVPSFPQMLARRRLALVAVDEAHCISHWGHDFRPDYRLLGERLPLLRPAPILALTATATVRVQDDILEQLGIPRALRFIHGFRRDNLAIEAVERTPSQRLQEALAMLRPPERRPAVVYVPTRRQCDQVAAALGRHFRTAPYHAGLPAPERDRAQKAFLDGSVEVVVATIAFGMGIDKADIRTVVHLALPGTVEGYYQEIGRAGRDGQPARALLLYSYGDRCVHESFLERDYPPAEVLEELRQAVPEGGIGREELQRQSRLGAEVAERALDKLYVHGGVRVNGDDRVHPGQDAWRASYEAIRRYRALQLDDMLAFARSSDCRMVRLVRHFGDTRDRCPCGQCDVCRPRECLGRNFRPPTPQERAYAETVLAELDRRHFASTGALFRALHPDEASRDRFERTLDALARAGAVRLADDSFEKEGKTIRFRRASLCPSWRESVQGDGFLVEEAAPPPPARPRKKGAKGQALAIRAVADDGLEPDPVLVERLRRWRLELARARRLPAFRILTDRTLQAVASLRPQSLKELLEVPGIGAKLAEKHGAEILRIVQGREG
jgi:DNA topoisomerase-3